MNLFNWFKCKDKPIVEEIKEVKNETIWKEIEVDVGCITLNITFTDGRKLRAKRYGWAAYYYPSPNYYQVGLKKVSALHVSKGIINDAIVYDDDDNPKICMAGTVSTVKFGKTVPHIIKVKVPDDYQN